MLPHLLSAQNHNTVTGVVTDGASGEPLPGVTVSEKGQENATSTNSRGEFTLEVEEGATLVISSLGYLEKEVQVDDQRVVAVVLEADVSSLEEVVVMGYTQQKRIHLTGAVDAINAEEIEDLPLGNLGAGLRGRMLGLNVSGGTSRPGHDAQLSIRNPVSLAKDGGNNLPLFVIDGVLQIDAQGTNDPTFFNNLDPSEVESISILKDAAAAVYGSRAANGVVIVTTKRGHSGAPRITYSGSVAFNDEAYRTKMMNAYELARYVNIVNGPYGANENPEDKERFFSPDELEHYRNIDHNWLDQAWSSAYNTRHTLNASGGSDKATYFAGVSWFKQDGNLGKLNHQKWTFRAGADVDVASGLKAGLQVSGNQEDIFRINSEIGGENEENDYRNLLKAPPYIPPYIDGLPVRLPGDGNNLSGYHFFEINELNNYRDLKDFSGSVNLYAEYSPVFAPGLKVRGSYARSISSGRAQIIGTEYSLYQFDLQGANGHIYEGAINPEAVRLENDNRLRLSNTRGIRSQANLSVNYSRQFGDHTLSAFATVERSEGESHMEEILKDDPSPFTNGTLRTAFGELGARDFSYENASLGYVGQVNYRYQGKYLADLMFRSDASTKFAPENYWGSFWSLGLGWVLSEEDFFNVGAIDFFKIRYSVGVLGKDDTRAWGWRQRYTFQDGQGAVFGEGDTPAGIGMKMEASPNRDATWSDDFKQNLGIDARFLDSRLSLTLEGFYNKSKGMLLERTAIVPVTVGGTVASQNYGEIDFFGYEIGLGWDGTVGNDFTYGIATRFTWADNKQTKGNFNEIDIQYPWNPAPGGSTDNGKWGFDYLGMFRSQEEIDAYVSKYNITSVAACEDCDPVLAEDLTPGMFYYRDVRGPLREDGTFGPPDGVIDNNDQIRLSRKASNHYGLGMTLRAGYKGFRLEAVVSGSFGGWSEIDARGLLESEIPDLYRSGPAYWADVYDPELNPTGRYPNPYWEDVSLSPLSSFWRVGSFRMRVQNINLSYTLPRALLDRFSVGNARVILSGVNPLNLYNPYSYRDSEGAWEDYPVLRTWSLGVNLTF